MVYFTLDSGAIKFPKVQEGRPYGIKFTNQTTKQTIYRTDIAFTGSSIVRDKVDSMIQTLYCQNKTVDEVMTAAYNEIKTFGIKCE